MMTMDIIEFFFDMTGFQPTEDQAKLLRSLVNLKIKKIIISAGRQTGKTLCCAVAVLYLVFIYEHPVEILLVSAQGNYLYDHMRKIFGRHPEFEDDIVSQGKWSLVPLTGFETKKGSIVHVKGSTDRQIRGISADIVFIDEACEVRNEIIETSLGNLSGDISKFIMLSTPHEPKSYFVEWATEPKFNFDVHNWSAEGLSWHLEETVKFKKETFTAEKYKVEVLGVAPTKNERSFFTSKHLTACCKPFVEKEGGPNSEIEIGIDWGFVSGTTLAVIERIGPRVKVLWTFQWVNKAVEVIAPIIGEIINKWNPKVVKADAKPDEYQGHVENYTKHRIEYINANYESRKEVLLAQLHRVVEKHLLEIPEDKLNIIIQFRKYKRNMRRGDDYVDAIALANYRPEALYKPQKNVYVGLLKSKILGGECNEREREIRF